MKTIGQMLAEANKGTGKNRKNHRKKWNKLYQGGPGGPEGVVRYKKEKNSIKEETEQLDEVTKDDLRKLASVSSKERDRIAAVIANYRDQKRPNLKDTQRLIQKFLKTKYKQIDEAMTYAHTEPATEDLDCEHPECVGKDVPSTQEHFFKDSDGKLHQIGTCDKHGLDAEGMATKPAQALSGYKAAAAEVIAKEKQKPEKKYMTNSYKPETPSLMDAYVQAIDADADFKTVKEDVDQLNDNVSLLDEGKYGPPKVITPSMTKKASAKGYDRPDSENITRAVEAIRQHNVKSFLKDLPKNAPTSKQMEYAKAANPTGFPKVRMGNRVSITIGAHGNKEEAQRRAENHQYNLITKHGYETQTFVKPSLNGFNYGVLPVVSKAPEDDAGKKTAKKAKNTVKESLFTKEELERIAYKLFVDLDEAEQLEEAKATYCGRCGTTHVKPSMGGKCPAVKEDLDQLDEISKEKMLKYHLDAHKSADEYELWSKLNRSNAAASREHASGYDKEAKLANSGQPETYAQSQPGYSDYARGVARKVRATADKTDREADTLAKKAARRREGIARAANQLTKEEVEQLDSTDEYTMQEGTYHKVKYPSSKGEKPLERSVFIPGEEDDSEPHRRQYAKEKDLAAKVGDPNKITQADTLAARLESGIKTNKDPNKVGDMLKLLSAIKR